MIIADSAGFSEVVEEEVREGEAGGVVVDSPNESGGGAEMSTIAGEEGEVAGENNAGEELVEEEAGEETVLEETEGDAGGGEVGNEGATEEGLGA